MFLSLSLCNRKFYSPESRGISAIEAIQIANEDPNKPEDITYVAGQSSVEKAPAIAIESPSRSEGSGKAIVEQDGKVTHTTY